MSETIKAPEYRIETVRDFLTIPADRRRIALHEFLSWLEFTEKADILLGAVRQTLGADIKSPDVFHWVDDDLGEVRVCATATDGTVIMPETPVAKIIPETPS